MVGGETLREQSVELVKLRLQGVVVGKSGSTFHLTDDRVKRAVGVLRRAEIPQSRMRLSGNALHQRRGQPRFADPGLAGKQHHLALAAFRPAPPPQQQLDLLLAADQWRGTGAQRLEPAERPVLAITRQAR